MKVLINALDRQRLLLMISLLCFFNGLALVAAYSGDKLSLALTSSKKGSSWLI